MAQIRRIPIEILCKLALLVQEYEPYDVFNVKAGPWAFGRVCHHWRTVSQSYPGLWSCISVDVHDLKSHKMALGRLMLLLDALRFSRTHPLTIYYTGFSHFEPAPFQTEEFFDTLADHLYRWKSITIISNSIPPRLCKTKANLPSLTHLCLCLETGESWAEAEGDFTDVPQLRSVTFEETRIPGSARLPWSQLTEIILETGQCDNYIRLLRQSPQLEHLVLGGLVEPIPVPAHIVHTSLRSLYVTNSTVIQNVELPALEVMHIAVGWSIQGQKLKCPLDTLPALCGLLQRSRCSLRELHLSNVDMKESLRSVLQLAPTITSLQIIISFFDEDHDKLLTSILPELSKRNAAVTDTDSDEQGPLLPCLEKMALIIGDRGDRLPVSFLNATFIDILESRWQIQDANPPATRLCSFHLNVLYLAQQLSISDSDIVRLGELKTEGMNISIRTKGELLPSHFTYETNFATQT